MGLFGSGENPGKGIYDLNFEYSVRLAASMKLNCLVRCRSNLSFDLLIGLKLGSKVFIILK